MPKFRFLLVVLLASALVAAACGNSDAVDDASGDTAAGDTAAEDTAAGDAAAGDTEEAATPAGDEMASEDFPVTIESAGGTWTLDSAPQRIVSLSPTATEILFAIGAGDQVVAVDSFSSYPAEAPVTDLSGFDPNVEAVTAFEPDLVVIANDANELVAGLTALGVPVLVSQAPADIEGGYAAMAELGIATGHVDQTATAVADLRERIDAALAAAPDIPVRVYHELDETYFSASSFGFIGAVYEELGTINIADEADPDGSGFPQLTEEYIVEADPELIIITDQVSYSSDDVVARPGWGDVAAVVNGQIVVVNADTASRWGPRLPDFITAVAEALSGVTVPSS